MSGMGDKRFADTIRHRYPLAAAVLDSQRCPASDRYALFARHIDSFRRSRGIPTVGQLRAVWIGDER